MVKHLLAVCLVVVAGCAAISEMTIEDKFEKTARAYRQALQWGDWVAAGKFLGSDGQSADPGTIEALKQIKVTSYEVNDMVPSEDKMHVQQVVEIQYFLKNRMIEKTLIDNQRWAYKEDVGWRLISGLPKF